MGEDGAGSTPCSVARARASAVMTTPSPTGPHGRDDRAETGATSHASREGGNHEHPWLTDGEDPRQQRAQVRGGGQRRATGRAGAGSPIRGTGRRTSGRTGGRRAAGGGRRDRARDDGRGEEPEARLASLDRRP